MRKLPRTFYAGHDAVALSRQLLGKVLATRFNGTLTAGIITEAEAYTGANDRASHTYAGRRTKRNEVMYGVPGHAYVYLCYGIHHLFNVVTNEEGTANGILIRAIRPLEGLDMMLQRRGGKKLTTGGPGTLSQALGIRTKHNGIDLLGEMIWIEDRGITIPDDKIEVSARVGVDFAGEDAALPYRFQVNPSAFK